MGVGIEEGGTRSEETVLDTERLKLINELCNSGLIHDRKAALQLLDTLKKGDASETETQPRKPFKAHYSSEYYDD